MDSTSPTADRIVGTDDSTHALPETTLVENFFAAFRTPDGPIPTAIAGTKTRG